MAKVVLINKRFVYLNVSVAGKWFENIDTVCANDKYFDSACEWRRIFYVHMPIPVPYIYTHVSSTCV